MKCKVCGIAFTDHLGLEGTCKVLQLTKLELEQTSDHCSLLEEENKLLREALKKITETKYSYIRAEDDYYNCLEIAHKTLSQVGGGE